MSMIEMLIADVLAFAADFIASFSNDYDFAIRIMRAAIDAIRKAESDMYVAKQRDMLNKAIGDYNRRYALRMFIGGGRFVKGVAQATYNASVVHWRNALTFAALARRKRRIRNINSLHDRVMRELNAVTTARCEVGMGYGNKKGNDFNYETKEIVLHSVQERKARTPVECMTPQEKFMHTYNTLRRIAEARRKKESFIEGIIVPKNKNCERDYIEFKYDLRKGDFQFLAIDCARMFFRWMCKTTGDVKKWGPGEIEAIRQEKNYNECIAIESHLDAMYAFWSSEFDKFMDGYVGDNNIVREAYNFYRKEGDGVTRSDLRERKCTAAMLKGKSAKKEKHLDPYSKWIEDSSKSIRFGGTDNHLYNLALQASAEALMYCEPGKHPEKFKKECGKEAMYVTYSEIQFILYFVRNSIRQESKSLKHDLSYDIAVSQRNFESDDFDYDAERYRQLNIKAIKGLCKGLDSIEDEEEIAIEKELLNLKTKHPYDAGCLLYHFESLDSRLINGTDCRVAFDQLINAKNRAGNPVFTEREKLLLILRRKGWSIPKIAKTFQKDYARVSDEFIRLWCKPAAQEWLKDLGRKGVVYAGVCREKYAEMRESDPEKRKLISHEYRDMHKAMLDEEKARDAARDEAKKAKRLRTKELEERKKLRDAHATLN